MPATRWEEEVPLFRDSAHDEWTDEASSLYELDHLRPSGQLDKRRSIPSLRFLSSLLITERQHFWRFVRWVAFCISLNLTLLVAACGVLYPSYSDPPQHYRNLLQRVQSGNTANLYNEKIFIAASLYDERGELLSGHWAASVLRLVEMLGKDNVFLSLYEDNADDQALAALDAFSRRVTCQSHIVAEKLDLASLPHVRTFDGTQRLKRITFLADVRNRALLPLENATSPAFDMQFDKLLYLNDVIFDPIDAANLLFSTNLDQETGRTRYRAACATDFIDPFKFYDTYATRDLEGYDMGIPFYPWFTNAGQGVSRRDVLEQKDAVRVKSCWGGMVAFEAKWFQDHVPKSAPVPDALGSSGPETLPEDNVSRNRTSPLRFRASEDAYWDGSECCFIHADLAAAPGFDFEDHGIYMNPYIRVAYSSATLSWLGFTRRFERLYTPIHWILSKLASRPTRNIRQFQHPGETVIDRVWTWDDQEQETDPGHFEEVSRPATPGGFCGVRHVSYLRDHPREGESKWFSISAPGFR